MGTRKRDAERRQVSLAVEALEDRFLLSSAISLPTPTATTEPIAPVPPVPAHALGYETGAAYPQVIPSHPPPWQIPANLLSSPMGYQRDNDGDIDSLDRTDGVVLENAVLAYPLSCSGGSDTSYCLDFILAAGAAEKLALPATNQIAFPPLLAATGLGATSTAPVPLSLPANTIAENVPGNFVPSLDKEEMRPLPAVPETPPTTLPPLAEEPAPPTLPELPRGPLAELLSIDMEAIQRGVDAFFQQLGDLSEEWRGGQILEKLAPWFLAASVAGYGWVRFREFRRPVALSDFPGWPTGLTEAGTFLQGEEQ